MRKSLAIAVLLTALGTGTPALAAGDCVAQHLPTAKQVGQGEGRRMIFHAYDATLLAPQGTYRKDKPFALTLRYHMQFSGKAIARESVAQMRRMGQHSQDDLTRWGNQMAKIFPNVQPGATITGLRLKNGITVFCTPAGEIGRIAERAFTDAFFDIWLGDAAESQTLRRQLTGQP